MTKKKNVKLKSKIPVSELVVDGVYKTIVSDIIKIQKIDENTQTIVYYNITGAFKQWKSFKHIYLIEKLY